MSIQTAHAPLYLRNATSPDGARIDVLLTAGQIAQITPYLAGQAPDGVAVIDLEGGLLTPSFVDSHVHLDKVLLGLPFIPHKRGETVAERIALEKKLRSELTVPVFERGAKLIEQVVTTGTGALRSHVDIDSDIGLKQLYEVVALREAYADLVDIQIVAFPQSGILRDAGVADLLANALCEGADLIGGLDPTVIDGDLKGHLDHVFGLAERFDRGVDIHLHEGGALGLETLRDIAARSAALGLQGRVAVSHAFALGEPIEIGPTLEALAQGGVAIVTHGPGPVPMPPIMQLKAAGVLACAGSDNIRDTWSPYGNGDMLERAGLIGYRQGMNSAEELSYLFDMACDHGAQLLQLAPRSLHVGAAADLCVFNAGSTAEAVGTRAARRMVLRGGRIVARDGKLCRHAGKGAL